MKVSLLNVIPQFPIIGSFGFSKLVSGVASCAEIQYCNTDVASQQIHVKCWIQLQDPCLHWGEKGLLLREIEKLSWLASLEASGMLRASFAIVFSLLLLHSPYGDVNQGSSLGFSMLGLPSTGWNVSPPFSQRGQGVESLTKYFYPSKFGLIVLIKPSNWGVLNTLGTGYENIRYLLLCDVIILLILQAVKE